MVTPFTCKDQKKTTENRLIRQKYHFLVNIFVRHTFSMSKSSIKTKTVLTMTDMTDSTELLAFKRQKDDYKGTVKISLCICVVLS